MEYIRLGQTGLKVSRLCLGMMTYGTPEWRDWVLDEAAARPFIQRALEAGINFFDTADMYSLGVSEEVTGRLLKEMVNREEVVVATKVYFPIGKGPNGGGLSRKHIMEAIDNSLRRLGMEYVDLYQIHRWDYDTPIEETMEALHDVVKAGKARYIGASSMFVWQFAKAQYMADLHGWTRFVSMQNHYNLVYREEEREMIPFCRDQGVGLIPWSPLARGFLAGNRQKKGEGPTTRSQSDQYAHGMYYEEGDFAVLDRVIELAEAQGVKPAQIALAWMLHKPGITAPIIGASKMYQLEEAIAATDIHLSDEEISRLEEPYQPHPILGHG
ncbi:MAG: aldo/keto reductase [Ardenticatenaceae bacterium]|nr:aldo/keto reductase [Ardenticatenaceae bacterium]MCB8986259.1 aldo/keto reductase [Ardenticatenaceae bacterium]